MGFTPVEGLRQLAPRPISGSSVRPCAGLLLELRDRWGAERLELKPGVSL